MDENGNSTAEKSVMDDGNEDITCQSISEASFVSKFWRAHTDKEWILNSAISSSDNAENKTEDDVSGVALKENIRLAIPPSSNHHRGRRSKNQRSITRFHQDLKSDDLDGMVAMFQAKAEQSISLALSPWPSTEPIPRNSPEQNDKVVEGLPSENPAPTTTGKVYEIVLGANNNTATTIRRFVSGTRSRNKNQKNAHSFVAIPSRVCRGFGSAQDNTDTEESNDTNNSAWTSYWVCLSKSRLYVGMGKVPGKKCFAVLGTEEEEEQQQQQQESPADKENEVDAKVEVSIEGDQEKENNNNAKAIPIRYFGIGNKAFQKKDSVVEVKNLVVTNVPPCLDGLLQSIPSQDDLPIVCLAPVASASSSGMDVDEDAETLELKKYMEDYKAECLVRKKRAKKYGTDYKVQPMKDFLPWTMAKRLKGENGSNNNNFVGGSMASGFVAGDIDFLDPKEISKRESRLARFAASSDKKDNDESNKQLKNDASPPRDGLPIEQAWDKEVMLRPIRRDPPPYLWKESPANSDTQKIAKAHDPFSMYDESTKAATWIADKLHISSIDWAAFKQIRNDDLIKHLEAYGPIKYIEWLGDVSCNVCFANKASASRALVCLSNELPSPPPQTPTEKTAETTQSDGNGIAGLPPMESTVSAPSTSIDLGCMTWRLGKRPIRKIANDRHGRKGTTARYLLRVATTEDVLIERPSSWPEPPGGFAPDRVLGPKSDFAGANKKKTNTKKNKAKKTNPQHQQQQQQKSRRGNNSKRKRGRGENNAKKNDKNERRNDSNSKQNSTPLDLLNRGLSSSRGGFSVEEMERERQAKKRQKTN
eukprot:CAMPEP_0116127880 /NCGR_PEP_ID=MMETSP0329-20121206/7067_1 /TAXON_ID=697910 /ORGANISM="Pseudo-nitzschia arenysensis, Strain B593" /LENGTH=816 /DNA_ID=CAMNT_0003621991 /DNA_START=22 /DNA_END=2472 /DNA_ORIENTATION=-